MASDRHSHVVRMLHWSATQRLKRSTLDHLLVALVASDRHSHVVRMLHRSAASQRPKKSTPYRQLATPGGKATPGSADLQSRRSTRKSR